VAKAFREASLKGWRYALTHGNEVADRIARDLMHRRSINDPVGFIRSQIEAVTRLTRFPVVALGSNDLARWRRIHTALSAAAMIEGNPPPEVFVYDPARDELCRRRMIWAAFGATVYSRTCRWLYLSNSNS